MPLVDALTVYGDAMWAAKFSMGPLPVQAGEISVCLWSGGGGGVLVGGQGRAARGRPGPQPRGQNVPLLTPLKQHKNHTKKDRHTATHTPNTGTHHHHQHNSNTTHNNNNNNATNAPYWLQKPSIATIAKRPFLISFSLYFWYCASVPRLRPKGSNHLPPG